MTDILPTINSQRIGRVSAAISTEISVVSKFSAPTIAFLAF